jgi:ligand-binding SRPBCC domain-containing protein
MEKRRRLSSVKQHCVVWWKSTDVRRNISLFVVCLVLASFFTCFLTLKIEVVWSSETSVDFHQTTHSVTCQNKVLFIVTAEGTSNPTRKKRFEMCDILKVMGVSFQAVVIQTGPSESQYYTRVQINFYLGVLKCTHQKTFLTNGRY